MPSKYAPTSIALVLARLICILTSTFHKNGSTSYFASAAFTLPIHTARNTRTVQAPILSSLALSSSPVKENTVPANEAKPRTGPAQWLLNAALASPLWKLVLVPQAFSKIVKTAEDNGIQWDKARRWIEHQDGPWSSSSSSSSSSTSDIYEFQEGEYPEYYKREFHAYDNGNLCWKAAFEQELASRAVGARNFPAYGEAGEDAFRGSFDAALVSLGAKMDSPKNNASGDGGGGIIVDLGCGTGTSTRRLAKQYPNAKQIIGMDLSPYFIAVGTRLLQLAPKSSQEEGEDAGHWVTTIQPDSRIDLRVANAEHTKLDDQSVDVVNLMLVIHELPISITKQVCDEALRILKPGGQLWISEMDFDSPAYAAQRDNALLFSLLRATEPYLDEYADGCATLRDHLLDRFASVKIAPATGRHYALVATKPDTNHVAEKKEGGGILQDLRFNDDGSYAVEDTHLKLSETKR